MACLVAAPEARAQRAASTPSVTRSATDDLPALLTADEVVVDDDLGLVIARGNVEINQGARFLRADTLTFNRRTNVVTATGNVALIEPTGEVSFVDFIELTSDMRDGTLRNLRLLLADQSRFAAVTARRADGSTTVMRRATYSPCEPCAADPTAPPRWQLRADKITNSEADQRVTYNDAWFEVASVPLFYTPYFSHPTGGARRQSGFLLPEGSYSQKNGFSFGVPYYQVIDESSDFTFTPIYNAKDNPMTKYEYRQQMRRGQIALEGAYLNTKNGTIDPATLQNTPENRGYYRARTGFDITDEWRAGTDLLRASDKTFLQRYNLRNGLNVQNPDMLQSRVFAEGFMDRDFASVQALAFQGLRPEDDPRTTASVAPVARFDWYGTQGDNGNYLSGRMSAASISRETGTVSQRLSAINNWSLPYTTRSGEVYLLQASVQTDAVNVSTPRSSAADIYGPHSAGFVTRALPTLTMEWRYPHIAQNKYGYMVVEPVVGTYVSPRLGDQSKFPNEDSRGFNFDDTNLLRTNRYGGFDRVESATRVVYGGQSELRTNEGQRVGFFAGQQYRLQNDPAIPALSGVGRDYSNFVGRTYIQPVSWLVTNYRFVGDSQTGRLQRNIVSQTISTIPFVYSFSIIDSALESQLPTQARVRQASHYLKTAIDSNWSVTSTVAQNLTGERGLLYLRSFLAYEDDCFIFIADVRRRNIGRVDIPPDTAVIFRFGFKTLGGISVVAN